MKKCKCTKIHIVTILSLLVLFFIGTGSLAATSGVYTYNVNEDGKTCTIVYVDNSIFGNVQIPTSLNGYTVTQIGESAFAGKSNITSITVPGTVEVIGHAAFAWCNNLSEVNLNKGLKEIRRICVWRYK